MAIARVSLQLRLSPDDGGKACAGEVALKAVGDTAVGLADPPEDPAKAWEARADYFLSESFHMGKRLTC